MRWYSWSVTQSRTTELVQPDCTPDDHRKVPAQGKVPPGGGVAPKVECAPRLFRAISDLPRLMLVAQLAKGETCVTELASVAGESLSTISQRLRVLRAENIVVGKRFGRHINYS